jgi:isocitrate dehydrogenase (NAD+)
MLLCAANLLEHASLGNYGNQIRESVYKVLAEGKVKTKDLGGYATTKQFTNAVVQHL